MPLSYAGLFGLLMILNLIITSVIYVEACSCFVYLDAWNVGVKNITMIDDEVLQLPKHL
jgi:hypothetical protein